MSRPPVSQKTEKAEVSNDSGAYAAWGAFAGLLAGAGLGFFTGRILVCVILLGLTGWLIGAFVERARR